MNIAYLGPEGTYSHKIALKLKGNLEPVGSWAGIARDVANSRADLGVMVHYNLIDGVKQRCLDEIYKQGVHIVAAMRMQIVWHAMMYPGNEDKSVIYSHETGFGQNSEWIERNLPNAKHIEMASTGAGAKKVNETHQGIALASREALIKYSLEEIAADTGNVLPVGKNYTDFYIIARENDLSLEEGIEYQTRFVLTPHIDMPGLMHDMTEPFKEQGINLTDWRSRTAPHIMNGNSNGVPLMFYAEADCHQTNETFRKALEEIEEKIKPKDKDVEVVRILGSYGKPGF